MKGKSKEPKRGGNESKLPKNKQGNTRVSDSKPPGSNSKTTR